MARVATFKTRHKPKTGVQKAKSAVKKGLMSFGQGTYNALAPKPKVAPKPAARKTTPKVKAKSPVLNTVDKVKARNAATDSRMYW